MSPPSLREQRQQQKRDLNREHILNCAEVVFAEKGFHDTSVREIAENSEFSLATVYSLFKNKSDLYASIWTRRGDDFEPRMAEVFDPSASPTATLHRLADFQIDYFQEYPSFARLVFSAFPFASSTDLRVRRAPNIQVGVESAFDRQAELFSRGQKLGEFKDGDPYLLSHVFSGVIAAYQSVVDPDVEAPGTDPERPLLHRILDDAFVRG